MTEVDGVTEIHESSAFHWISLIHRFLEQFSWLADSFVLDFYYERHWEKLPLSWQSFLPGLSPEMLADFVDLGKEWDELRWRNVPPLSLMALKSTVKLLSLKRTFDKNKVDRIRGIEHDDEEGNVSKDGVQVSWKEFRNLFTRHVKPKKRHEIEEMAQVISSVCKMTGATHVYDVGAGLGHLSRYLTYGCGLRLTCVDREEIFGHSATKFDKELESFLLKKQSSHQIKLTDPPSHLCLQLELDKHEQHFQQQEFKFGLTGLHSCGNLSPVILHNFANSPAVFVMSLGCCYMKMDERGFPLSPSVKNLGIKFSYEALEVACHALEQYCDRLRDGHVRKLMTHSYRATLETILRKRGIIRAGLRGVPHTEKLSFQEYAIRATRNLDNLNLSECDLHSDEIATFLSDWFKVVLFYSLRLMIANVVESAVLLDRALFVKESYPLANVYIKPVFEPKLSPRNLAVICTRN